MSRVPASHPVKPIRHGSGAERTARDLAKCYTCGRQWDDGIATGIATGMTPTPSGRCPFEYYH